MKEAFAEIARINQEHKREYMHCFQTCEPGSAFTVVRAVWEGWENAVKWG